MSLLDGGGHLRREAGRERGEALGGGVVGEQPVAEFADGERTDGREGGGIVRVDDEARDFVGFVGDDLLVEEMRQRQIGEGELRGDALLGGCGGDAGELVAGARGRGLGQQLAQVRRRCSVRLPMVWAKAMR